VPSSIKFGWQCSKYCHDTAIRNTGLKFLESMFQLTTKVYIATVNYYRRDLRLGEIGAYECETGEKKIKKIENSLR
jgi:hypothetical protein